MTVPADAGDLLAALARHGVTDASDSTLDRALHSSDASLYRVVPRAVVRPRSTEELLATLAVAREAGVPLTMRGAGTSIAGNAVGPGIVVDTRRHLHRVLSVDAEARTAHVEPGVVHAHLQQQVAPLGLRFGPDPSTHTRCTIGGMIGNNACGSRALGYGRTSDNVAGLSVAFGNGEVVATGPATGTGSATGTGPGTGGGATAEALASIVDAELGHVRTSFGTFSRQGSGYALEQLLPENGRRVDRLLAGSEGTLGVVLDATVRLVEDPPTRVLLVLGYPSMPEAADAVPAILATSGDHERHLGGPGAPPRRTRSAPSAVEGLDARIVGVVRAAGKPVPALPRGDGWLFVELPASTVAEAEAAAARLVARAGALDHRVVTDEVEQLALWRIREDGAGLAARTLGRPAYSGWEDAAVPPEHLGAWLRDFDALLKAHELDGVPYGHFGDGCVHVRIDFGFDDGGARFRGFLFEAARAVAAYGGSMSGEHGDGRARSELLPLMYDERSLRLFGAVKHACDPDGILNPGVLVDPAPLDADLRPARAVHEPRTELRLAHDGGSLGRAVHRCTGVGKCLADNAHAGGVMCPSYLATGEEKDSTRGRARVLQEALDGSLVDGLADPAVHEALDLCLSCKGCASDCPTGVDMASYKSEALQARYARRLRPRAHYALGRLPLWARLTPPKVANRMMRWGPTARLARAAAGVDQRRSLPAFAERSLRSLTRSHVSPLPAPEARDLPVGSVDVWIWADTFTDRFHPDAGLAAIRLLEAAGQRVGVLDEQACCALTWITTGQLTQARRILERTVTALHPYVESGTPVLGLEPSCLATLRGDAAELVRAGVLVDMAEELAAGVRTLAEHLTALAEQVAWEPPDLTGLEVVAQPHCHHASVLGWEADHALLRRAGATVTRVGGCCGLAGNFGVEKGHHDVSVAIAEHGLLPAVRAAGPDAVVLADGLSCRHQLADLAGVRAVHLAELLADGDRRGRP